MSLEDRATLKASEEPLGDILGEKYSFEIPNYQRPYAWGEEQVGELFDDLLSASQIADKVEQAPPYFLGSIVLIKHPESREAQVVDGQQRLTSLTILFGVLRDMAEEDERKSLNSFLLQPGNSIKKIEASYRLTVRKEDADFFKAHIQDGNPGAPGPKTDSQRRMLASREMLKARLGALEPEARSRLSSFLALRCYLVVVAASDRTSAYRVFSVMNDRGLSLTATDILKADVIGAIPETEQEKFTDMWVELEDELGREPFNDLFTHIRMIARRTKNKRSLIDEFREHVAPTQNPKAFISDTLMPFGRAYDQVLTKRFLGTSRAAEINTHLKHLHLVDNVDWQPVAIDAINRFQTDEDALESVLRALDALAFQMFTLRADINARIRRYGRVLKALDEGADVNQSDHPLHLTEAEEVAWLETMDGPVYQTPRIVTPLLLRADTALSDAGAQYDTSVTSVEHICPQSFANAEGWKDFFSGTYAEADPEEQGEWIHALGNLTLLSRRKNSQARNFPFRKKVESYFLKDGVATPFVMTQRLQGHAEWTFGDVLERQGRMMSALAKHFGISGAAFAKFAQDKDWIDAS